MPNWCVNRLQVRGAREEIGRFVETASGNPLVQDALVIAKEHGGGDVRVADAVIAANRTDQNPFSFAGHVPEPEYTGDEWYDWRIRNWGCKWDACQVTLRLGEDPSGWMAEVEFDTPWGPPYNWLVAAAGAHPALVFEMLWNEEQGILGKFDARDGVVTSEEMSFEEAEEREWSPPFQPYDEDEECDPADADVTQVP